MIRPVEMHWDGKVMIPQPRFVTLCKQQYTAGEIYTLGVVEERSTASHNHYFACVTESWQNLPEDKVARYPSPNHLRKWALIRAGYYNERNIVCINKKQSEEIVALVEAMDEYAVTTVKENVVRIYTAMSQSIEAMKKDQFEKSKQDVLAVLAQVIGVKPKDLSKQGEQTQG